MNGPDIDDGAGLTVEDMTGPHRDGVTASRRASFALPTGAAHGGVPYVGGLGAADGAGPSDLDLLRATVETIASGLAE